MSLAQGWLAGAGVCEVGEPGDVVHLHLALWWHSSHLFRWSRVMISLRE
jgi:hypothetical protein